MALTRTRVANGAVLGAVAVLVAAAGVDAIRGHDRRAPRALGPAAALLAAAHVSGTLYLVDADCRLRALRLPSLVAASAPRAHACSVAVAPHRLSSASWSLWPPGARLVAFCRRGRVLVRAERGPTLPFIVGCAPAWGPTGALTLVRQGSVVQFVPHGRAEVVMPARGVREVAWRDASSRILGAVMSARRLLDDVKPDQPLTVRGKLFGQDKLHEADGYGMQQQLMLLRTMDRELHDHNFEAWRAKQVNDFLAGIWSQGYGQMYADAVHVVLVARVVGRIIALLLLLALTGTLIFRHRLRNS